MTRTVGHKGLQPAGTLLWRFRDVRELKSDPDYDAAKAGDRIAAARLVMRLADTDFVENAKQAFGRDVVYVPVHAEEARGRNRIPEILAEYLSVKTGAGLDQDIVQSNRTYHTGANAMERLLARSEFAGEVKQGKRYVLVDDVTTMGGTLADLAGFIQSGGGEVAGSLVLTNTMREQTILPSKSLLQKLEVRHGQAIRELFGIETNALTASEAGYLIGFRSTDELRNRGVKARQERDARILSKAVSRDEGSVSAFETQTSHIRKALSLDALRDRFIAARDAHSRRLGESRAIPPVSEQRDVNHRSTDELRDRFTQARDALGQRVDAPGTTPPSHRQRASEAGYLEGSAEDPLTHRNLHPPPEVLNRNDLLVESISRGGHMAAQLDHLLSYGPLDVVGSNDEQNPGLHIVNMDAENRAFIPRDDPLHREIRHIIEKNPHSRGFAANQIHARLEQEGRWDGPDRDAEGLSFSPSMNPEPEKAVETEKKLERDPEKAQKPTKKPDLAAQDVDNRKTQTVSLKMANGQDLPEHYAAEVKMIPLVLDEGTMYPAHTRPDLPIAEYGVQRGLRDTRFEEFGKTLGNGHYRVVTQTRAKTLEEAQKRMAEYAQQPVQPQELNALKQQNAQNVEIYEARQAEQREVPEQARQEPVKAPEPEQAKDPVKTPENAPEKDPLGLGDVKKPTEHLFPEQQAEKGPEKESDKPKFERKNPPEVLFANPKGKPYVLDHGDKVSVTNRAMLGLGHEAAEKRRKAVEIGLKAAVDRFGEPVRFQGNRAFLEETVKVAMERGIKLEPASPMAKEIYERAVKEHGNQFGPSKAAPYRAPEKKQEMDKGKGIGL